MKCRHCKKSLKHNFLDLGYAPPSNAYLSKKDLNSSETYYPLKVKVCDRCWLVQTEDYTNAEMLFSHKYAYFSSSSSSWIKHAKNYSDMIIENLRLNRKSFVVEVASNDGYLLKNFVKKKIPCLGIEPTKSTANAAKKLKIPIIRKFFGKNLAKKILSKGQQADLIIGNNVYAHVPDINDFTDGLKILLKPGGTITLEFPHLMSLIKNIQFDTIYHEHFSYLSLYTVSRIFSSAGLRVMHVEEIQTHGGSLRVYGCHQSDNRPTRKSVNKLLNKEFSHGLRELDTYTNFIERVNKVKDELLSFLIEEKKKGNKVVGYGAAAKGNTLINYAGIKPDLLPIVYDISKSKQYQFLPGSHIPILPPKEILKSKPKFILILPWNIKNEIKSQDFLSNNKGIKFITAIPKLSIS